MRVSRCVCVMHLSMHERRSGCVSGVCVRVCVRACVCACARACVGVVASSMRSPSTTGIFCDAAERMSAVLGVYWGRVESRWLAKRQGAAVVGVISRGRGAGDLIGCVANTGV